MNPFSLIGFILAGLVLAFGIVTATSDWKLFFNLHAVLIVVGGSLAASAIAFQLDRIFLMFKVFFMRVLNGRAQNYVALIQELMLLAEAHRTNPREFQRLAEETKELFLKDALASMTDEVLDREGLEEVLRSRVATIHHRHVEDANRIRTIAKYPPAFGLMGTTLGMISLLQKLGEANGQKLIGPAMSIALVATFLGIAIANLVLLPLSENLLDNSRQTKLKNMIIVEGVLLIADKTNPIVLAEKLNSYLLPSERIDWKVALGKSGDQKKAA